MLQDLQQEISIGNDLRSVILGSQSCSEDLIRRGFVFVPAHVGCIYVHALQALFDCLDGREVSPVVAGEDQGKL